ncbi:MAG TPA: DUF547 domain-containing protein [Deltaproteobacteria bacterium]|nr:DUF547 domain-containing protein [Deltaproteobacteria bacterium]
MGLRYLVFFMLILSASPAGAFDFSLWEGLLDDHLSRGERDGVRAVLVDYKAVSADSRFGELLARLDGFDPAALSTREARLAFWINVYNIMAVKVVVDNYPLRSIKDAGGIFSPVWKKEAGRVGGRAYSLDEIEHSILRKMNEPRIHFAIVCASLSCPDLRDEPYRADRLNRQLNDAARTFLADPTKGLRADRGRSTLYLSSIFKWFAADFDARGGVLFYISRFVDAETREFIATGPRVRYMDYNWKLNGR